MDQKSDWSREPGTPAESNLVEFLFAALARRPEEAAFSHSFVHAGAEWELLGGVPHGLPGQSELELLRLLIRVTREQGFPKAVAFSEPDLLSRLEWGNSAASSKRLFAAFRCLAGTCVRKDYSLVDAHGEMWPRLLVFPLLESCAVWDAADPEEAPTGSFRWGFRLSEDMWDAYLRALGVDWPAEGEDDALGV